MKLLCKIDFCKCISSAKNKNNGVIVALDMGAKQIGVACTDTSKTYVNSIGRIDRRYRGGSKEASLEIIHKLNALLLKHSIYGINGVVIGFPMHNQQITPFCKEILKIVDNSYVYCKSLRYKRTLDSHTSLFQLPYMHCGPDSRSNPCESHTILDFNNSKSKLQLLEDSELAIPCILWDEYNTTSEAKEAMQQYTSSRKVRMDKKDEVAASIILSRFLEDPFVRKSLAHVSKGEVESDMSKQVAETVGSRAGRKKSGVSRMSRSR